MKAKIQKIKDKLQLAVKRYKAKRPSKLPVGMAEFEVWAESFHELYKMPTEDRDSVKFVLANTILTLGPQEISKSKEWFYKTLTAGAIKQIAGAVFYDIKTKQKAAANEASNKTV